MGIYEKYAMCLVAKGHVYDSSFFFSVSFALRSCVLYGRRLATPAEATIHESSCTPPGPPRVAYNVGENGNDPIFYRWRLFW